VKYGQECEIVPLDDTPVDAPADAKPADAQRGDGHCPSAFDGVPDGIQTDVEAGTDRRPRVRSVGPRTACKGLLGLASPKSGGYGIPPTGHRPGSDAVGPPG